MALKYYLSNYKVDDTKGIEDGNFSSKFIKYLDKSESNEAFQKKIIEDIDGPTSSKTISSLFNANLYDSIYHSSNMRRNRSDIYNETNGLFDQTYRFGLYNPYGQISTAREFLFFTKPDLHLYKVDDKTNSVTNMVAAGLNSYFWDDMFKNKKRIIKLLQSSYGSDDPFNHLLQNTVVSNLEVPSLNAPSIETATNTFGISLTYRGSSESSDDGPEFTLEFKDDKYLNVYTFFRAYEEYETLKKHGVISPQLYYVINKVLHDQFAIYKFIVDEDMETLIYWGKYYGVYPTSLPRDAFNTDNFSEGLSFPINFKAAFYEDMKPEILCDFNELSSPLFQRCTKRIDVYNEKLMRTDGRAAKSAMVFTVKEGPRAKQNPNGYYYKLVWKGDDIV